MILNKLSIYRKIRQYQLGPGKAWVNTTKEEDFCWPLCTVTPPAVVPDSAGAFIRFNVFETLTAWYFQTNIDNSSAAAAWARAPRYSVAAKRLAFFNDCNSLKS